MSAYDYRDRVDSAIDTKIAAYTQTLANGACKDMTEYGRLTGTIQGLEAAKGIMLHEYKRMFETRAVSNVKGSSDEAG